MTRLLIVAWGVFTGNVASAAEGMPWSEGPIPIRFTLEKPGYVTLVVEDAQGKRVRNLIAEEKFPAGEHTVFWDGADGADTHLHKTQGTLVNPGQYSVRGLVRDELKLIYEFAVYNPGSPPWGVRDEKTGLYFGRWLSDHNLPSGVLFLPHGSPAGPQPQLMFCAGGAEWGDGFMWTDLDGKKLHGQRWAGGVFSGGERLARDVGTEGAEGIYAYSIKGIRTKNKKMPEAKPTFGLRVMAFTSKKAQPGQDPFAEIQVLGKDRTLKGTNPVEPGHSPVAGLAVWKGLVVVSAPADDELILIDAKRGMAPRAEKNRAEGGTIGEEIGGVPLKKPRGLAFNPQGDLFALSGNRLLLFPDAANTLRKGKLPEPRVLVGEGLEDPTDVTLDSLGRIYISDRGTSHQVKLFSAEGKLLRTIGKPGGAKLGAYDEQRMFNPAQVAVTDAGEVWVAESQFTPRRISRWKTDGTFLRAYYGPPGYGGGGRIQTDGQSVVYCHGDPWNGQATIEFAIDWKTGNWKPTALRHWIDAPGGGGLKLPGGSGPVHRFTHDGRVYYHNAAYLQGGTGELGLWMEKAGKIVPVAALGQPADWKTTLLSAEFQGKLPKGVDPNGTFGGGPPFAWADLDGDGRVQPGEVRWYQTDSAAGGRKKPAGFTVQAGFTLMSTDGKRIDPISFAPSGAPIYDWNKTSTWVKGDSGTQNIGMVQLAADGTVMQFGIPIVGWKNGERVWTYPCEYQGVHGSHASPKPRWGGDIVNAMKNPGPLFTPRGGEAGQMWALSSNWGCLHLGTTDGLYVATVMRDDRIAGRWPATIQRGDNVIEYSNGQESFGVTLQQLDDGRIILSVGGEMIGLARLEGLETVRRIPARPLAVSAKQLEAAVEFQRAQAARRKPKDDVLQVMIEPQRRDVTAKLDDWKDAAWVTLETARIPVNFGTKPMDLKAAMRVCGNRLHVAWLGRAGESWVANSVENPTMQFKTGAALDIMLGAKDADPTRNAPAINDQRLLVARTPGAKGIITVMLYRQKSTTNGKKQTFSSPWRSVEFDEVREVTKLIEFKESPPIPADPAEQRLYEIAIPLQELGLVVKDGLTIRGDVGFLRGTPGLTSERVYWHNKISGLTADVPGEAMLEPAQWGTLRFVERN